MKVFAVPLTAVSPMEADGFAPVDCVMQVVPSTVKHPARTPPANVDVPPDTVRLFPILRYDVVALVPMALVKLSVPSVPLVEYRDVVVAPVARRLVITAVFPTFNEVVVAPVNVPLVIVPFVAVSVVAKRLVDVAEVVVARVEERY